ncbi:DUF4362 domain-containing protein [Cohnella caldifontis]|uniref:DUF4362 domain-containing protein n=1 Tax=Cohnella caldifontis TaxID=3027471 RepID=UPI003BB53A3D
MNVHGKLSNKVGWQHFLNNLALKKPDSIRITSYTVEGAPVFDELFFNGERIKYAYDNSMDGFAGQGKGRRETLCTGITKKQVNESKGKVYVLVGCQSEALGNTFSFDDSPLIR